MHLKGMHPITKKYRNDSLLYNASLNKKGLTS